LLGLGAYGLAQDPANPTGQYDPVAVPPDGFQVAEEFTGSTLVQRSQPPAATKVEPKGIEDEDVPYGDFPAQAVARIEDGKLVVRQRSHSYAPVTVAVPDGGRVATGLQRTSTVGATSHDPADIAVFDMKGNRLQSKAWKESSA
jgi:hypothetical protein